MTSQPSLGAANISCIVFIQMSYFVLPLVRKCERGYTPSCSGFHSYFVLRYFGTTSLVDLEEQNAKVLAVRDWQPRLDYESLLQSPERQFSSESRRSKSFEEREEEYEKARKRIFNREVSIENLAPLQSPTNYH